MKFKYLELFAGTGIGGMALDYHGGKCVGYSEIDKDSIKNYEANFTNRTNYGDITKIRTDRLPRFDVLIGGSPCTDISIMSKTWSKDNQPIGLEGNESRLFFEYIRILNNTRPKHFIFENVRNLLNSNNGADFKLVKKLFEENYNIQYAILNTADYGIPQTRRRVYIIGQRKDFGDFKYEFPSPIGCETIVQDILLYKVDDKYYLTQKMYDTVMAWGTKGWSAKPETDLEIARPLTATMSKMHRASQDNYYHTDYKPQGKTNLRRLIPRECARLQGLDDTYKIVVSDTQAYRLFGNAMSLNVLRPIVQNLIPYI